MDRLFHVTVLGVGVMGGSEVVWGCLGGRGDQIPTKTAETTIKLPWAYSPAAKPCMALSAGRARCLGPTGFEATAAKCGAMWHGNVNILNIQLCCGGRGVYVVVEHFWLCPSICLYRLFGSFRVVLRWQARRQSLLPESDAAKGYGNVRHRSTLHDLPSRLNHSLTAQNGA